jgi:hypothetical protein
MQTPHLGRYVAWDGNDPFTSPSEPSFVVVTNSALRPHSCAGKRISPGLVAHHQRRRHEDEASFRRADAQLAAQLLVPGVNRLAGNVKTTRAGWLNKFVLQ